MGDTTTTRPAEPADAPATTQVDSELTTSSIEIDSSNIPQSATPLPQSLPCGFDDITFHTLEKLRGFELNKTIVRAGAGEEDEVPGIGDEVKVSVSLKSGETDSDVACHGGQKFSFTIGDSTIPSAMHAALCTMRKGELATFKFDSTQLPETCQVNSTFGIVLTHLPTYEIEFSGWLACRDLFHDGGVMKRMLVAGSGPRPDRGYAVQVLLRGRVGDVVFDDRSNTVTSFVLEEYTENSTIMQETLCTIIRKMRKGECSSSVIQSNYGYGEDGDAKLGVPANATLIYDVKLVDFDQGSAIEDMSPDRKLELAVQAKTRGNHLFKDANHSGALAEYAQVLSLLENDLLFPPNHRADSRHLKLLTGLNVAACQLKLGDYKDVVGICTQLVKTEPKCTKAYFRRAQAYQALGEFSEALRDFDTAAGLDGSDAGIVEARQQCVLAAKKQDEKDRARFKVMMGGKTD